MTTPRFPSICFMCEYFVSGIDSNNTLGKPVCRAFPEGIPSAIIDGGYDHRQPWRNETITFKLGGGATPSDLEEWEKSVLETKKQDMLGVLSHFDHRGLGDDQSS